MPANVARCYIDEEARTFVPFDSPACLLAELDALRREGAPLPSRIFIADYEDGVFRPAEATSFLLTDHLPTVMGGGVLGFGSRDAARRFLTEDDELITDWLGFRTARGEPDRMVEISFGPDGMSPERVSVDKGQLVVFQLRHGIPDRELVVAIKGYPEVEPIRLPKGGEAAFRLLATRPGSGFPIVDVEGGETLGALEVRGAHTLDEAAAPEEET